MKPKYIILVIMLSCVSCALFKKTSKTTATSSASSVKQMELSQFLQKQANKETQIISYWNDSGFYQIQNIKERIDETKSERLKSNEKQINKEKLMKKESKPLSIWAWIGIAAVLALGYLHMRFIKH